MNTNPRDNYNGSQNINYNFNQSLEQEGSKEFNFKGNLHLNSSNLQPSNNHSRQNVLLTQSLAGIRSNQYQNNSSQLHLVQGARDIAQLLRAKADLQENHSHYNNTSYHSQQSYSQMQRNNNNNSILQRITTNPHRFNNDSKYVSLNSNTQMPSWNKKVGPFIFTQDNGWFVIYADELFKLMKQKRIYQKNFPENWRVIIEESLEWTHNLVISKMGPQLKLVFEAPQICKISPNPKKLQQGKGTHKLFCPSNEWVTVPYSELLQKNKQIHFKPLNQCIILTTDPVEYLILVQSITDIVAKTVPSNLKGKQRDNYIAIEVAKKLKLELSGTSSFMIGGNSQSSHSNKNTTSISNMNSYTTNNNSHYLQQKKNVIKMMQNTKFFEQCVLQQLPLHELKDITMGGTCGWGCLLFGAYNGTHYES